MTKHTPGPWEIEPKQARGTWIRANGSLVALACMVDGDEPKEDANAHLISAAPDLLDALKALVDTYGSVKGPLIRAALAAIAKAEGL
jgi:hypothetical protein